MATQPPDTSVVALGHAAMDIADADAVARGVSQHQPDVLINAAAYTAVDKAESNPELAYKVNAEGAGVLAEAARRCGARFMHISTDFVFDGSQSHPYAPGDVTHPLGVYAASKLKGEQRVREILGEQALILRTAWVYAATGGNFVRTILRLAGEHDKLTVVADQVGSPTWARSIADALWEAVRRPRFTGIHHWTDAGVASWYDFAVAVVEEALALGLLKEAVEVQSIPTSAYPTPARRPAYSVLDRSTAEQALGLRAAHWRANLRKMLLELRNA
jgi:dTDP-4-dehydrorhamnose reductase